jgi:hypothetical protein
VVVVTLSPTKERAALASILAIYNFAGYFGTNVFNIHRAHYFDPSFAFEDRIPFVPVAIFAYLLVWVNLCVGVLSIRLEDMAFFRRAWRWLMLNATIAYVFFLLLPVRAAHRPVIGLTDSLAERIAGFYFYLDAPTNLLPSLHVELALMAGFLCLRHSRWLGAVALTLAGVITVSVLLVKQHYVVDIVLAVALVVATGRWMGILPVRRRRR